MSVDGIGIDVVSLSRTERCLSETFTRRVFTDQEIDYAESHERPLAQYAMIFAGKEATFKALGTGWTDGHLVEVVRDDRGQPRAVVHDAERSDVTVHLSLAYEGEYAFAIALLG
jgi:holo-[acyl-carrier protein] synthase